MSRVSCKGMARHQLSGHISSRSTESDSARLAARYVRVCCRSMRRSSSDSRVHHGDRRSRSVAPSRPLRAADRDVDVGSLRPTTHSDNGALPPGGSPCTGIPRRDTVGVDRQMRIMEHRAHDFNRDCASRSSLESPAWRSGLRSTIGCLGKLTQRVDHGSPVDHPYTLQRKRNKRNPSGSGRCSLPARRLTDSSRIR